MSRHHVLLSEHGSKKSGLMLLSTKLKFGRIKLLKNVLMIKYILESLNQIVKVINVTLCLKPLNSVT